MLSITKRAGGSRTLCFHDDRRWPVSTLGACKGDTVFVHDRTFMLDDGQLPFGSVPCRFADAWYALFVRVHPRSPIPGPENGWEPFSPLWLLHSAVTLFNS